MFLHSVRRRVRKWGYVEVLYENEKHIRQEVEGILSCAVNNLALHTSMLCSTIGGMNYRLARLATSPPSSGVPPGVLVASTSEGIQDATGRLARICRPTDTEDARTTITHAWVNLLKAHERHFSWK
jgi:hypothetical protein